MTGSGKENKQRGVLLRKPSKVHKRMCQESVRERKRGIVSRGRLWDLSEVCVTCCLTNGERKVSSFSVFSHCVSSPGGQADQPGWSPQHPVSLQEESCMHMGPGVMHAGTVAGTGDA